MFTDSEIEEIYSKGGYQKVWKLWKLLWIVVFSFYIPVTIFSAFSSPFPVTYFMIGVLALSLPILALMSYFMSPALEKKRIRKLNSFTEGTVTGLFDMYGMKGINYTFEENGREFKGTDTSKELLRIGETVRIGYQESKPKNSKYIPIKE